MSFKSQYPRLSHPVCSQFPSARHCLGPVWIITSSPLLIGQLSLLMLRRLVAHEERTGAVTGWQWTCSVLPSSGKSSRVTASATTTSSSSFIIKWTTSLFLSASCLSSVRTISGIRSDVTRRGTAMWSSTAGSTAQPTSPGGSVSRWVKKLN